MLNAELGKIAGHDVRVSITLTFGSPHNISSSSSFTAPRPTHDDRVIHATPRPTPQPQTATRPSPPSTSDSQLAN